MKKFVVLFILAIVPFTLLATAQPWINQGNQIMEVVHSNFWEVAFMVLTPIIATIIILPIKTNSRYLPIALAGTSLVFLLYRSWQLAVIDIIICLMIILVDLLVRKIKAWLALIIYRTRISGWRSLWRRSRF